jgi:hypothetical protein
MARRRLVPAIVLTLAVALVAAGCSDDDNDEPAGATTTEAPAEPEAAIVFNGEGNNLNAIGTVEPFEKQTIFRNHNDDPNGLDINAQICFFPDESGWFIAGEDTNQPDPPPGWGIFDLTGDTVGDFKATQVGKLTPTYQASRSNPENYGCGFLEDGRVVTTDIGDQATGDGNGQLIVWFPPFDSREVKYCKIDTAIPTAGQIYVDGEDNVFVGSTRPGTPLAGILRYRGPFPTSNDAAGGCGKQDATGAPLTDTMQRDVFIKAADPIVTPNAMVPSGHDTFYVSSVFNGVIAEYDGDGALIRTVLKPPAGESLGEKSYSTGTPLGLGVDAEGTLYYADIGIVIAEGNAGPGDEGSVRRIRFVNGEPQAPEVLAAGLAFPDGIGIFQPAA